MITRAVTATRSDLEERRKRFGSFKADDPALRTGEQV